MAIRFRTGALTCCLVLPRPYPLAILPTMACSVGARIVCISVLHVWSRRLLHRCFGAGESTRFSWCSTNVSMADKSESERDEDQVEVSCVPITTSIDLIATAIASAAFTSAASQEQTDLQRPAYLLPTAARRPSPRFPPPVPPRPTAFPATLPDDCPSLHPDQPSPTIQRYSLPGSNRSTTATIEFVRRDQPSSISYVSPISQPYLGEYLVSISHDKPISRARRDTIYIYIGGGSVTPRVHSAVHTGVRGGRSPRAVRPAASGLGRFVSRGGG